MNIRRLAPSTLAVLTFLFSAGCSKDPQPSQSDIRQAITVRLPAFVRLSSLSVEAVQNMGTKVEPVWLARFRASARLASDTFVSDGAEGGVTFVRLLKSDGESIELFGKTASTLYAGTWRTSVEFEGQTIEGLGLPESAFGPGKVIVRGSNAETAYLSEQAEKRRLASIAAQREAEDRRMAQERANEERRKMLADAPRLIVGTWRTQYGNPQYGHDAGPGLVEFRADGSVQWTRENGQRLSPGTWSITADELVLDKAERWRIIWKC